MFGSFSRTGVQNSYNHNVRIKNWLEEKELHELKIKDYLHKKETGSLLVNKVQKHLSASLQGVELKPNTDGVLHSGDSIMLYSVTNEGVLSVDTSDRVKPHSDAFAVSSSTVTQGHVARNVFSIEAFSQNDKSDVITYGQLVRIVAHEALHSQRLSLASEPVSLTSFAKISRKQEVYVTSSNSSDGGWRIVHADPTVRFETEGQPVPVNAEILIVHNLTKQALFSDRVLIHNDFGQEFEVSSHLANETKKRQALYAELNGTRVPEIPLRRQHDQNSWVILAGAQPEQQQEQKE